MNFNKTKRGLAHWKEVALAGLGALAVVASIGHFLDWLKDRSSIDWELSLAFFIAYGLFFFLSAKRFSFIIISLSVIVVCGSLNALLLRTTIGFFIVLPCALLVYILLKWKGHLLK